MGVVNGKQRFATEGIRFQRHNPDGSIPTPQRFLGFANNVNLSRFTGTDALSTQITIKVDAEPAMTRAVNLDTGIANINRATVPEIVAILNNSGFTGFTFSQDISTTRLKGSFADGTAASFRIELVNDSGVTQTIPAGLYSLFFAGRNFLSPQDAPLVVVDQQEVEMVFTSTVVGVQPNLPIVGEAVDLTTLNPGLPGDLANWNGEYVEVTQGVDSSIHGKIVQVIGPLAAALDFGQGLKHKGNGLEVISFFDDETISIGLPKDIKEKEEIDSEGAKGTINRMIIGAMLQGMSPVVTLSQKNYFLLEMIQGGNLDRVTGTYDPPLSSDADPPTFYAEIFSGIYSRGSNKISNTAGYEKLLLRSMIGHEGDIPIEAKSWAQYSFSCSATEYTDIEGVQWPAWQEQSLTLEQFDALRVKQVSIRAAA